ncbi:hypothetical protein AB0B31_09670 [Catellatospora citrea]|uniref:hypothetical protein n=1 Tax=Catellatospora citrea TaxID=53366 RepID=UPI00340AE142
MKAQRSLNATPLWIITILGAAVTALGVYVQTSGASPTNLMIAGTLAALGGGIVGAAVSMYLASGEGRNTLVGIGRTVDQLLGPSLRSNDAELVPVRREWHYYHLTRRDGVYLWRHTIHKFDVDIAPNVIVSTTRDHSFNVELSYRTEVALRGDRMMLVESPTSGNEPPIIAVTPYFTEWARKVVAGVILVKSFDGEDLLSKCLWSQDLLVQSESGDVSPERGRDLDVIWRNTFKHRILPSLSDNDTVASVSKNA